MPAIAAWSFFAFAGMVAGLVAVIQLDDRWRFFSTRRGRVAGWVAATAMVWIAAAGLSWGLVHLAPTHRGRGLVPWVGMVLTLLGTGLAMRDPSPRSPADAHPPTRRTPVPPPPEPEPIDPERERRREEHRARIAALRASARSRICPTCGAAAFSLEETFQHHVTFATSRGLSGGAVYELVARCSACGGAWSETELR